MSAIFQTPDAMPQGLKKIAHKAQKASPHRPDKIRKGGVWRVLTGGE